MHSALKPDTETLPPIAPVRPMLMLTGFLGAGKTTLLRNVLNHLSSHEHLADVILNDRENANIDRETLRDHAASVAALTGSCVCCEGLDELCGLILKASKSPHKVLLIELNGTADPLPLQETFTLLEPKFLLQPRWQVCVVDARNFGNRGHFNDLEKLQFETASHYYISHTSDLNPEKESQLIQDLKTINPQASRTTASDLADALSQAIYHSRRFTIAREDKKQGSDFLINSPPTTSPTPHLHDRHQLAHEFTGCNIVFPTAVKDSRIIPWLEKLSDSVIRAKALITLSSDPSRRYLYERVGLDIAPNPIPVRSVDRIPCSGLFIGPDLNPEEILQFTRETLSPDCHFPKS